MSNRGGHRRSKGRGGPEILRRWILAGLAGPALSIGIIAIFWPGESRLVPVVAIAIGWIFSVVLMPRNAVGRADLDRRDLGRLTETIEAVIHDERDAPIARTLLDRDDDMGQLSRAIHRLMTVAIARRIESHNLQRTLEDRVRREASRLASEPRPEAPVDEVTGLARRSMLDEAVAALRLRAAGTGTIAMLLVNVDGLDEIREHLGDADAEACLRHLGGAVTTALGPEDAAVRFDDHTIAILMPHADASIAANAAQSLGESLARLPWSSRTPPRPCLTVGVAAVPAVVAEDPRTLLRSTVEALAAARRAGPGTVHVDDGAFGAAAA
jgi:diguanylate cyclase (GGDEF)-like protein